MRSVAARLLRRIRTLVRGSAAERDLREELQFHIDRQAADFARAGLSPADARAAALREFGGVEQAKEACRDARGIRTIHDLQQDLRYAGRMVRKHAGLTAVVMVTLGVGIGANTALFSVVDAVLLKPLPFPDAGQVVVLREQTASRPNRAVAFPDFLDWQARQTTFDGMAAALIIGGVLSGDADAERVFGRAVTRNFFATLGTGMLLGRPFTAEEDQPGGARVIVLSHGLWQRRYHGDAAVIGRATSYNGESHTIVGVLPATFDFYGRTNAACVNVANLLLARASTRRQEMAVRLALGARRGRVVRQLLTESLVLSSMGGALGLLLAWLAAGWLARLAPVALPRMEEIALDWRVVLFGAATTTLTGLAFGIAPALQTSGVDLQHVMRTSGRAVTGAGKRLREGLVVGQIALCVALLIATGLLVRSFQRLSATDPGYDPANVVSMRLRLPDARYSTREQVLPVLDALARRIAAMPGVESVCLTSGVPLGRRSDQAIVPPRQPEERRDRAPLALTQWVSPGCHQTFGILLLAGRPFTNADRAAAAPVAIVDDEFVRRYLPGREPAGAVGERVRLIADGEPPRDIIGVVRHIRHSGLDEEARAEIYVPFEQARPSWQIQIGRAMDIAVRSATPADTMVAAIRAAIREFDPELPLSHVTTLEAALEESLSPRLFNVVLLSVFGGAAVLLCVVGVYGVVSYSVAQRTREIGVRMTLGAQPGEVIRLVMGRGMRMVLGGVAAGAIMALLLARVLEGLLYGVRPRDPLTYVTVAVALTIVAAAASYLPARRAASLELTSALRQE